MAGKTGRGALVSQLQQLCVDYRAFRHIAKNSREPEKWSAFLNSYRQGNSSRTFAAFDEVTEALQNGLPTSEFCRLLSDAIAKAVS